MRKLIIILLLFSSCQNSEDKLNRLDAPVILVAKSERGAVILQDANGKITLISGEYISGSAISNSYNVGDTLKLVKK